MNFLLLPIHRPVAVAMFFLGVLLLGGIAWQRMPVELFPSLDGSRVYVQFNRPGSEPEVVEREMLLPLEARVSALANVIETLGEVRGSGGRYEVLFETDAPVKVRELEIQRIVAALLREQPRDAFMVVRSSGSELLSSLAMSIHVLGAANSDRNALFDLAEELIAPRFASISGVSQAIVTGGARRQVTVAVDPDRAAAAGVTSEAVSAAVRKNAGRLQYLGGLESEAGRTNIVIDGRQKDLDALGHIRVQADRPVELRHVSNVDFDTAREQSLFRVNGLPAVGLIIFQEDGANLVRLGRQLRARVESVNGEIGAQGIELILGQDSSEQVEDQINRLGKLGASGFAVALIVLFFFLREWRAVAVVGVAVPVSLLAALAMLFLAGQSLNLVSLFGLALAVGLVVDNSVVVFEAISRRLERGADIESAVAVGLGRTVRAILAASATSAVVFLPLQLIEFEDQMAAQLVVVVTMAILLPLAASLLVAVGLVPLLAHHLAAPAARRQLLARRKLRAARAGLVPPDRLSLLFTGIVTKALRHPPAWISGTFAAVLLTLVIAVNFVSSNSAAQDPENVDQIQFAVRFARAGSSLARSSEAMLRLERTVMALPAIKTVETRIEEDGGSLTVHLVDRDLRPADFRTWQIRKEVHGESKKIGGLHVLRPGEEQKGTGGGGKGGGDLFGGSADQIILSGPDSAALVSLAGNVQAQLESMPQVASAWNSTRPGVDEYWVEPVHRAFESLGLHFDSVLPSLSLIGREGQRMQTGFVQANGRELPLVVERSGARTADTGVRDLASMRMQTEAGVVPVALLASLRQMPAPPTIVHHNGRREASVMYRLGAGVPRSGPTRIAIDEQMQKAVRAIPRPPGYTIETKPRDESSNQFREVIIPVLCLLFLVLAMTFESLALPVLVLIALPLTLLGATWALAFAGMPFDMMAMLGAVALIGLTVNPAILLVDRMQQLARGANWSAGAAALAAVRERTRPVMMTTATTIAGLWPLAIATGRENEIWPPFATVVMGGLVTSSMLTLLMMPVGFILLRKLDLIFDRVGPWLGLAWFVATTSVMTLLIATETIVGLGWQVTLTLLTGGSFLALIVIRFRPKELPEPDCSNGPPRLDVTHLHKVYGLPGALRRALNAHTHFAAKVIERGGTAFQGADARGRLVPLALAVGGFGYLSYLLSSGFWTLAFMLVTATLIGRLAIEFRRGRGLADATGTVTAGGPENLVVMTAPWLALMLFAWLFAITPILQGNGGAGSVILTALVTIILFILQMMRRSARRQAQGELSTRLTIGSLRPLRNLWRSMSASLLGLDLPLQQTAALNGVSFSVDRGMVGILGPNGAGKTTLIRQLAGVLDPTRGAIKYGGVRLPLIQRYLAHWVGYLPQDAGLPGNMSPYEYLTWFAALYDIGPHERDERVRTLLEDVGLTAKADERIKALSGGMRQRVAVARTLLRLPPIIIVDEPTVGLDPRERIRFRNLLSRLARDRIVLFSTHVVEDVAVACDRVLVIDKGELVFDGPTADLNHEANGCVWETRTRTDEAPDLPHGSIHLEEKPIADGSVLHRIISGVPPVGGVTTNATLEDGYMWLLAKRGVAAAAEADA